MITRKIANKMAPSLAAAWQEGKPNLVKATIKKLGDGNIGIFRRAVCNQLPSGQREDFIKATMTISDFTHEASNA